MADSELKCCNCLNPYLLTGTLYSCVTPVLKRTHRSAHSTLMYFPSHEGERSRKMGKRNSRLPMLLPCSHTFCSQCLPRFSPQATTSIQCPLCKVSTHVHLRTCLYSESTVRAVLGERGLESWLFYLRFSSSCRSLRSSVDEKRALLPLG